MNIDTSKLPMTLDAIRREVIKSEGERIITKTEKTVLLSILIGLVMFFILTIIFQVYRTLIIREIYYLYTLIYVVFMIGSPLVLIMRFWQPYFHKKLAPKNYGLSEADIEKKVVEYTHDILHQMQDEMKQSEKDIVALQQKYTAMKNAYYEPSRVYSSFVCKQ